MIREYQYFLRYNLRTRTLLDMVFAQENNIPGKVLSYIIEGGNIKKCLKPLSQNCAIP